jgi:hypothetical protein
MDQGRARKREIERERGVMQQGERDDLQHIHRRKREASSRHHGACSLPAWEGVKLGWDVWRGRCVGSRREEQRGCRGRREQDPWP